MSELAKSAREAMRQKAMRMANGAGPGADPSKKIDASGWSEPTDMNCEAKTGMRPVSRRQYRSGGKVMGEKAACRADRKPRKIGGRVNDDINRNVREANAEIAKPHVGGYARGGATNFRKQMHADVAEDKRLIKHMVKKDALRVAKRDGGGRWIQKAIEHPGALHKELHVPKGEKIPAKKLNKAAHSDNPKLAKRARLAETLGKLHKASGGSANYEAGMRPKGDRIPRASGGRTKKGKTNIAIVINPGHAQQAQQMPAAPARPPAVPVPVPAPAGPQMAGGMPPAMGGGAPMQPPMPRKDGGKVVGAKYPDASISAAKRTRSVEKLPAGGGGLGRLAKRALAEHTYMAAK